jgi:hypothetical protein
VRHPSGTLIGSVGSTVLNIPPIQPRYSTPLHTLLWPAYDLRSKRRQDRDSSRMVATTARPACRAPMVAECGPKPCRVSSFRPRTN